MLFLPAAVHQSRNDFRWKRLASGDFFRRGRRSRTQTWSSEETSPGDPSTQVVFASYHEYLLKRVPDLAGRRRFLLSLYVPLIMRMLGQAAFCAPESRQFLRDMFADVRMLCDDTGLMNRVAKLMWRICKINGDASRYRNEPQRQHVVAGRRGGLSERRSASLRSAERLVEDLLLFDSVHLR